MKGGYKINMRVRSVLPIVLFAAYTLAFLFEGSAFYSITEYYGANPVGLVMTAVTSWFFGLLFGGLFVKNARTAKRVMLFGMAVCLCFTGVFFFPPSVLWLIAIAVCAVLAGTVLAAWGYFLKIYTPAGQRIKSVADVLIYSNILMILVNLVAIHLSPFIGIGSALLLIAAAIIATAALPAEQESAAADHAPEKPTVSVTAPLVALVVFVTVITINAGLMYQIVVPAYNHLTNLTSWYWAVPYITALIIMRNISTGRPRALYIGMGMIAAAFIFFNALNKDAGGYLVVDTLMLGACGIFDLFWWSILGEMLDTGKNPARVFGIGLAANVFGILLGKILALSMEAMGLPVYNTTIVALTVAVITLMLLPPLNIRLSALLKTHAYLTVFSAMPHTEQRELVATPPVIETLSSREQEVLVLLLNGKTNKAIAAELFVSENTVKTNLQSIYGKYHVNSRLELASMLLKTPEQ
jgi:DNA-binding CsgD family transcriptional regulator